MIVIERPDQLPPSIVGTVVSVGNFDGVHRGHARLVEKAQEVARQRGLATVVFTFDPLPAAVLFPEKAPPVLVDRARKLELLRQLGVDVVVVYPADLNFFRLAWHEFLDQIVAGQLRAQAIVEGPDFRFGRNREGDVARLTEWGQQRGIAVEIVPPTVVDGQVVSSSLVRDLLRKGEVAAANRFLTEPYRVRGRVVVGAQRGRTLGYPTANLAEVTTLLPAQGIYAGRAFLEGGKAVYPTAISLGPNPTFAENTLKFEAFLLDFSGDLYGQVIEVEFLERLREVRRFESVSQLLTQMEEDVATTRQLVESLQCVNVAGQGDRGA